MLKKGKIWEFCIGIFGYFELTSGRVSVSMKWPYLFKDLNFEKGSKYTTNINEHNVKFWGSLTPFIFSSLS